MADYSISAEITGDSSGLDKAVKDAQKSIKNFSTDLKSAMGLLGNLFVVSKMKNFAKEAISSVQETNKQLKLLDATLKTTGADAWTNQNKLLGMAQGFEKSSNYSKEQIMEMQTVLLGFKSVTNDVFESASQEIINMATVMGMDLKSAVQTVGKALDDPIAGLGSLSRQGFVFDESQKQLLKTMVAVGDKASAQKIILEELATTYGGAAEASVDSFRGLELSLGDLRSAIGEVLIPMASELADKVTALVNVFNSFSQGTKTAIVTVTGLVAVLPLVVKGLVAVKGAVLALKAANPVLLGVSAAVAGILLAVGKITSVVTSTQYTTTELNDKTEKLLGTYSKGNESKKLDAKTTQELIKLYPELSGKVEAYATTVKEAAEMQKKLNDEKIVTEAQAKISEIDTLANKYQWWKSQVEDVKKSITGLQNTIQQSPKSGLNVDRQRQIEAYKNRLLDLQVGMETAKNKVDEKVSEINKSLATVGKTLQGRSIVNLPEIKEQIDSDLSNVADSAKKSWQQLLADVLSVDIKLFTTGKEASRLYIKGIESELSFNKDIAKALGDLFNPKDELEKQAKDIKEAIGKILSEKNVDIPFSMAELTKQGTALGDLATKYKSLIATIKSLNIEEEIKDLEKQVANLGKSEIEVYKAKLKTNGATDEQIKKAVELKEKLIKGNESVSKSFSDLKDEIKKDAEDWSDVVQGTISSVGGAFGDMFTMIGENMAGAGNDYEDFSAVALSALSDVLKSLAAQLAAVAALRASTYDYASAAVAAAGAAAALVAAGVASAASDNLKKTKSEVSAVGEAAASAGKDLKYFQDRLAEIQSGNYTSSKGLMTEYKSIVSDVKDAAALVNKVYADYKEALEMQEGLGKKIALTVIGGELDKAQTVYKGLVSEMNTFFKTSLANIKEEVAANQELKESYEEIYSYVNDYQKLRKFWDSIGTAGQEYYKWEYMSGKFDGIYAQLLDAQNKYLILLNEQKVNIQDNLNSVLDSLSSTGASIGETLISSIVDGGTKTDFLSSMKKYIRENLLKIAVYTETFQDKLAEVGTKLSASLLSPTTTDIATVRKELEELYEDATENAKSVENIISEVFKDITDESEETTDELESNLTRLEEAIESFKDTVSDLGADIASNLVDGLTNGLSQSDFLSNMKDWLRKMLVQSVVYTETMKAEIEEIGKKISEGITSGFSETSLHEIRRDLSYIFEQASSKMTNIDSILDGVFSGYATGTENATRGLHIVGEAGPELVAFRGGERVLNNRDTMSMLSGSRTNNFNVTFNNTKDTSAFAMMSQLRQYNREMAINSVI
jgi:hypothetical protein